MKALYRLFSDEELAIEQMQELGATIGGFVSHSKTCAFCERERKLAVKGNFGFPRRPGGRIAQQGKK